MKVDINKINNAKQRKARRKAMENYLSEKPSPKSEPIYSGSIYQTKKNKEEQKLTFIQKICKIFS